MYVAVEKKEENDNPVTESRSMFRLPSSVRK